MSKPLKKELVWIEWQDAVGESARAHVESLKEVKLAMNTNLGWILHEDENRIVLVHGFSDTGEMDYFAIPKGDIKSITGATQSRKKANAQKHES